MVTAEEAFEAKKLASKYGVPGKVAARYRMAGYDIEIVGTDEDLPIHFKALKRREKLAVKVYWASTRVPTNVVEALAEAANRESAKPVLVLYGAGPKVHDELLTKARELGVSLKRVRP